MIKEFKTALTYTQERYANLFDPTLDPIVLVPSNRMGNANGRFWSIRNRAAYIQIRRGRRSVADYVGTLVHELTHLQQYVTGRAKIMTCEEREAEANAAGWKAQRQFVTEAPR